MPRYHGPLRLLERKYDFFSFHSSAMISWGVMGQRLMMMMMILLAASSFSESPGGSLVWGLSPVPVGRAMNTITGRRSLLLHPIHFAGFSKQQHFPAGATRRIPHSSSSRGSDLALRMTNNDHTTDDLEDDEKTPFYPEPRPIDENLLGDLTGGRPGAIIETEEQLAMKARILQEWQEGLRTDPQNLLKEYFGEAGVDDDSIYDTDDPEALDASTLGTWDISDLRTQLEYEWHPSSGFPDPNKQAMKQEGARFMPRDQLLDEEGVEIGYDPIFGPSNPMDRRTMLGTRDSYMTDPSTRNETMLVPQFEVQDPENNLNADFVRFRQSLEFLDTYLDPFLQKEVPRHVAKWHGYPEQTFYPPKNFSNNRFTPGPPSVNFDELTPYRARQKAVEMARAKNTDWLPDGVSQAWHAEQRAPYERYGTLVGTLRRGPCPEALVQAMQPVLNILGGCVDLLSITPVPSEKAAGSSSSSSYVIRFHYHGLMKNKYGMERWTETLLAEHGAHTVMGESISVVFETGFRRRDRAYDGGDPYNGPLT